MSFTLQEEEWERKGQEERRRKPKLIPNPTNPAIPVNPERLQTKMWDFIDKKTEELENKKTLINVTTKNEHTRRDILILMKEKLEPEGENKRR